MKDPDSKITSEESETGKSEKQSEEIAPILEQPGKKHETNKILIAIAIVFGTLLIAFIAANVSAVGNAIGLINKIISPVVIGFVIAYLCNPILKFFEYVPFKGLQKKHPKLCRGISIACTIITVLAFFTLVLVLIIPALLKAIGDFVSRIDIYAAYFTKSICNIINKVVPVDTDAVTEIVREYVSKIKEFNQESSEALNKLLHDYLGYDSVNAFITDMSDGNVVAKITDLLSNVIKFAKELFSVLKDIFLGTFIGFYVLGSKERLYATTMKCRKAWFSDKTNAKLTRTCSQIDRTFGGYIKGTLTDSLLVAVETFILFTIFDISEYNILLAVFIGITNIIPVFGPFIGAIPTGLIVLITNLVDPVTGQPGNPIKFWIFILIVIVVQQIDGNIILPKILGNETGVSSLCVLIAVTIMGNWLGVLGMVIGVPVFATAIYLIRDNVNERLKKKGKSTELADYYASDTIVSGEEDLSHKYNFFIRFIFFIIKIAKNIWTGVKWVFRKKKKAVTAKVAVKKAAKSKIKAAKKAEKAKIRAEKKAQKQQFKGR